MEFDTKLMFTGEKRGLLLASDGVYAVDDEARRPVSSSKSGV